MKRHNGACQAVRERLAVYLAGALDDAESTSIRRHLRSCKSCRVALAAETRLNRIMRQALHLRVDPRYWERTWPRIQVALVARRQRSVRRWLRWVLSGAGALAATAVALILAFPTTTRLVTHDASYFAGLPSAPPSFAEILGTQEDAGDMSIELAMLSMGNAPPSQRVVHWSNLEGL